MLDIRGTTINISRGDDAIINFGIKNDAGTAYLFAAGDVVKLYVFERTLDAEGKETGSTLKFEKTAAADPDDAYNRVITIAGADTESLTLEGNTKYRYEVRIVYADDKTDTPIIDGVFVVLKRRSSLT